MARFPINYNELNMGYLDATDLVHIQAKAKVLSLEQCFEYLCIDTGDIPPYELSCAKRAWQRGRNDALATAGDKLFSAMSQRGGDRAAFQYLQQLSGTFTAELTADSTKNSGFSFNVNLKDSA